MVLDISTIISNQLNVNIHKFTITSEDGVFNGAIELRVHDREDVKDIINQLKTVEGLQEVTQIM